MKPEFKTPRHQGDWGLLKAMEYFVTEGYECFVPLSEATRVDLIVMCDREVLRVQVKSSTRTVTKGRSYQINLCTSGGNQSWNRVPKRLSSSEIDIVFAWCANDTSWLFPIDSVEGKDSITAGHHNANDYLVRGELPPLPKRSSLRRNAPKPVCGYEDCPTEVSRKGRNCPHHAGVINSKEQGNWIPDHQLVTLVSERGFLAAGREIGVSDNAIRKRMRKRGLLEALELA